MYGPDCNLADSSSPSAGSLAELTNVYEPDCNPADSSSTSAGSLAELLMCMGLTATQQTALALVLAA